MKETDAPMRHQLLLAVTLLAAATSNSNHHLSIGPWIIIPILILAAIIAIPIYIVKDRRKRRDKNRENQ
jgi:4-hydroxybenzoate polyprenyltransferase